MDTQQLTNICKSMENRALPPSVYDAAKKCVLDYLGCAFGGSRLMAAKCVVQAAKWLGTEARATSMGHFEKISPLAAVFTNATLGSALDIDDGHRGAVGHPGVMVIPVALAAAEVAQRNTGQDFLQAVVIGYELAIRCGVVMNSMHAKRFYGSGGWAVHGASAAAATILGLEGETYANAMAVGEVYGPTAQCGKSIDFGAMTKESIGWGAMTALFGAFLAAEGFTAPKHILMDEKDYQPESLAVFETFGKSFEIENLYFKQYASCRWSHAPIAATLKIKEAHAFAPEDVEAVYVETFEKALTLCHTKPHSAEAAQYSVPFTVACSILSGEMGPRQLQEEHLNSPAVLDLAAKVKLVHAPDLEPLFPSKRPARVVIQLKDGQRLAEEVHVLKGDPEQPLSWEDIITKFNWLAEPVIGPEKCKQVVEAVQALDKLTSIVPLAALMAPSY